jgi:hypothetical protein
MKFLRCLICDDGEVDIIGNEGFIKLVQCRKCNNANQKKEPEITIIKRRMPNEME